MDPHTGVLAGLKVMVDRAARWKFSWQQSPLAACPQEVKDGVEDGTKVGGTRSAARSRRRQNWRNPGPRRVGQVGVVESRVHRTVPLARVSALSRQTSTFQTPSETPGGITPLSTQKAMLASCGDVRNSTVGPKRSTRRPVVGLISVLTCFSPWVRGSGARLRQHLLTRQTERQRSNRSRPKHQEPP